MVKKLRTAKLVSGFFVLACSVAHGGVSISNAAANADVIVIATATTLNIGTDQVSFDLNVEQVLKGTAVPGLVFHSFGRLLRCSVSPAAFGVFRKMGATGTCSR
jgi:hypothetical protein